MSIGDIILVLIVAVIVFFAARSVFVKKSGGCSGDCAHCGGCGSSPKKTPHKK